MKEDQPTPGSARRPASAPPANARIAELEAQVLALRALVEAMLAQAESKALTTELTKSSGAIITAVASRSPYPLEQNVLTRAKNILHLETKLRRAPRSPA